MRMANKNLGGRHTSWYISYRNDSCCTHSTDRNELDEKHTSVHGAADREPQILHASAANSKFHLSLVSLAKVSTLNLYNSPLRDLKPNLPENTYKICHSFFPPIFYFFSKKRDRISALWENFVTNPTNPFPRLTVLPISPPSECLKKNREIIEYFCSSTPARWVFYPLIECHLKT